MTKDFLDEEEISLFDLLETLKKYLKFIVIFTLSATLFSVIISFLLPKEYEATTILKVGKVGGRPLETLKSTKEILQSLHTLKIISKEYGFEATEEKVMSLKKRIDIKDGDGLMKVVASGKSPEDAEKLCGVVTKIILERHKQLYKFQEKNIRIELGKIKDELEATSILVEAYDFSNEPTLIETPPVSSKIPVWPKKRKIVSTVFGVSFIFSIFFSFFIEGIKKYKEQNKS